MLLLWNVLMKSKEELNLIFNLVFFEEKSGYWNDENDENGERVGD